MLTNDNENGGGISSRVEPDSDFFSRLDVRTVLFIILIIVFLFTHFHGLGSKPLHHDESIHANTSHGLYKGQGYRYDPVYHGPVLYYATATAFFLCGVSDTTSRLFPVLCSLGIFLLLFWYAERHRRFEGGALWIMIFLVLSPILTYFSRTLVMDLISSFFAVLLLIASIEYLRTKESRYFLIMATALSLLYCTKQNAHITAFIFCSFTVFYVVHYHVRISGSSLEGKNSLFSRRRIEKTVTDVIDPHQTLVKGILIFGLAEVLTVSYVLLKMNVELPTLSSGAQRMVSFGSAVIAFVLIILCYYVIERFFLRREQLEYSPWSLPAVNRNETLFFSLMLLIVIFMLFYTNFLYQPERIATGLFGGLEYWLGQQENPRIPGPFLYYVPIILIYELPLVIILFVSVIANATRFARIVLGAILLGGAILSTFAGNVPVNISFLHAGMTIRGMVTLTLIFWLGVSGVLAFLRKGRLFECFLCYWAFAAFIIYGLANEKVPWLTTHISLPLAILAGSIVARYFQERSVRREGGPLVPLLLALGLAFMMHNLSMLLHDEANPREMLVYVHSHEDVKKVNAHIADVRFTLGEKEDFTIIADRDVSWPFAWYLRDYNVSWTNNINRSDAPVILTGPNPSGKLKEELREKGFIGHSYRLRAWWIVHWNNFFSMPWKKRLTTLRKYVLFRETFGENIASYDFMYFYRPAWSDLARSGPVSGEFSTTAAIDVNTQNQEPDDLSQSRDSEHTVLVINDPVSLGLIGDSGMRQRTLLKPKDLEIGPDGSIYVIDSGNHRVQVYAKDGQWLRQIGSGKGDGKDQMNDPQGIAVDEQGNVYIADTWNHRLLKFNHNGDFLTQFGHQEGMWGPRDIEIGPDGNIYVADTGQFTIRVFSPAGKPIRQWGFKGKEMGKFEEPVGIAFLPEGNLVVADCGNRRIQEFDQEGRFLQQFPIDGWQNYYSEPYLATDAEGRIFMTDADNDRILVYSRDGVQLIIIEGKGVLSQPKGVVIRADGALVVTEAGNNRINIIAPPFNRLDEQP